MEKSDVVIMMSRNNDVCGTGEEKQMQNKGRRCICDSTRGGDDFSMYAPQAG